MPMEALALFPFFTFLSSFLLHYNLPKYPLTNLHTSLALHLQQPSHHIARQDHKNGCSKLRSLGCNTYFYPA